jgi:hypothetical protein
MKKSNIIVKNFDQLEKGDILYWVETYMETVNGIEIEIPKALETIVEKVTVKDGRVYVVYRTALEKNIDPEDGWDYNEEEEMLHIGISEECTSRGYYCTTKKAALAEISHRMAEESAYLLQQLEEINAKISAYATATAEVIKPNNKFFVTLK